MYRRSSGATLPRAVRVRKKVMSVNSRERFS